MFGLWGKERDERRIERQRELAEMEDSTREIRRKVDELKAALEQITERKRPPHDH